MGNGEPAQRITALTEAFERLGGGTPGLRIGADEGGGPDGELVDPGTSLVVTLAPPGADRRVRLHVTGSGAELRVWPHGAGEAEPRRERLDLNLDDEYCWDGIRFESAEEMAGVLLRHLERRAAAEQERA